MNKDPNATIAKYNRYVNILAIAAIGYACTLAPFLVIKFGFWIYLPVAVLLLAALVIKIRVLTYQSKQDVFSKVPLCVAVLVMVVVFFGPPWIAADHIYVTYLLLSPLGLVSAFLAYSFKNQGDQKIALVISLSAFSYSILMAIGTFFLRGLTF